MGSITNQSKRQLTLTLGVMFLFWNTILSLIWFFEKPENKTDVMAVWFIVDIAIILAVVLFIVALTLFPYEKDEDMRLP